MPKEKIRELKECATCERDQCPLHCIHLDARAKVRAGKAAEQTTTTGAGVEKSGTY